MYRAFDRDVSSSLIFGYRFTLLRIFFTALKLTLRTLPSEPGKVFETIPSRHRPLTKLESCIKTRSPVVRLRCAVWTGTDNTEMAEEAKSIRWTAKARFTWKRNELLKSMDANQGRKMVEGNYVKLSEAWDSNVSKARAPTARKEMVGKKTFFIWWNTFMKHST